MIGGLVHHGSGPRYTNLLDPKFPQLLADYAAKVAKRYPWIEYWTPVNEPLTTARFSCSTGTGTRTCATSERLFARWSISVSARFAPCSDPLGHPHAKCC